MSRVVVLGGGVAGLATAGLLAREGHEVTLLEAQPALGGRAGVIRDAGFTFDTGPSWWLMPEVFDHFFALMGTSTAEQVDLVALHPAYRVYPQGGEAVDVRSGRESALALAEWLEPGAGRALAAYLDSGREAYGLAVERFLHVPWRSPRALLAAVMHPGVLRRLPTLARLLLEPLETRVARTVRHPVLRQVLGYPAVFLGAAPRTAPSMYHLMSHLDLEQGVLYPRGGFAVLVERLASLAREHGAQLRTGARVDAVLTAPGAGEGVARRAAARALARPRAHVTGVRLASGENVPADVVVSTVDLHALEGMLPAGLRDHDERHWERLDPGPGAVLAMVGVPDPDGRVARALPHHTLLFTRDWQESFDAIAGRGALPDPTSIYVCRATATDPQLAPEGHEALFVLVPCPADPALGSGGSAGAGAPGVEAVADAALRQLADWAGLPEVLPGREVVRHTRGPGDFEALGSWQGSALGPAHTLAQSAMLRAGNISSRVAGLLHAGGTVAPGIGLPMCLISAQVVLKHLRGDDTPGPLPVS